MRKRGPAAPPEFSGMIAPGLLKKTQDYSAERASLSALSSGVTAAVIVAFVFGGLLDRYNSWISSLGLSFIASGWLFFVILSLLGEVLSVPFSIYSTFRIENRYGFNRMTPRLWAADLIKSTLLSILVMSVALVAGFWIIQSSQDYWWLWVWAFLFVFSVFMMYLSPYVIEPLFNKFTPLEEGPLRAEIVKLAAKAGIRTERVLKIDASRRSGHTNAYFTGIGKTKRIVLYDTLLEGLSHREVLAVLAHEVGHWKRRHLAKTLFLLETLSLAGIWLAHRLMVSDFLPGLFGISAPTVNVKIVLAAFLAGIVLFPLRPLACYLSRRHEREADAFSQELSGDAQSMTSALVKLSRDNLSNLYPHPAYVLFHYTHPPLLERVRLIRERDRARIPEPR